MPMSDLPYHQRSKGMNILIHDLHNFELAVDAVATDSDIGSKSIERLSVICL